MPFPGVRLIKPRPACARKINQGQVRFVDLHLSEVAQMVNYGFLGDIDVAVIEASAIAPDGRVWLSSGIGNAPTWLLRAKKGDHRT
jgi:propionyl-CoA:succinyl-CoA transferase